jgi:hypothetical protein
VDKIIPTNKARQGRWGRHVLAVLIAALALTAIVWAGVEFYGEQIDNQSDVPAAGGTTQPG